MAATVCILPVCGVDIARDRVRKHYLNVDLAFDICESVVDKIGPEQFNGRFPTAEQAFRVFSQSLAISPADWHDWHAAFIQGWEHARLGDTFGRSHLKPDCLSIHRPFRWRQHLMYVTRQRNLWAETVWQGAMSSQHRLRSPPSKFARPENDSTSGEAFCQSSKTC